MAKGAATLSVTPKSGRFVSTPGAAPLREILLVHRPQAQLTRQIVLCSVIW